MYSKVVIASEAKSELKSIYTYIKSDSYLNAKSFIRDIKKSIHDLLKNPKKHPPDKFKVDNDGSFRAYEIHHIRITLHVSDTEISILRIRHTKRNPVEY